MRATAIATLLISGVCRVAPGGPTVADPADVAAALEAAGCVVMKDATETVTEVRFRKTAPADTLASLAALPGLRSVVLAGTDATDAAAAARREGRAGGDRRSPVRRCEVHAAARASLGIRCSGLSSGYPRSGE